MIGTIDEKLDVPDHDVSNGSDHGKCCVNVNSENLLAWPRFCSRLWMPRSSLGAANVERIDNRVYCHPAQTGGVALSDADFATLNSGLANPDRYGEFRF